MKKVWIDTDPGIDDAFAMAMLFASPEIEVVGVSTIFGNVTVEQTTRNTRILLEAAGKTHIPVCRGASYPLGVPLGTSPFVHGHNGLGDMPLPEPTMPESSLRAPQAIVDSILANPNEITLLPIGPLTNIAMAYLLEPRISQLVKEVIIMGGAVHCPGNITPTAEANFFHDPHAAQVVISAGWNIFLAGLDVCAYGILPQTLLDKVCSANTPLAPYIKGSVPFFQAFLTRFEIHDGVEFPDALAAAYLLEPKLFTLEKVPLFVETEGSCLGQSIPVPFGKWYEDQTDNTPYKADHYIGPVNVMLKADTQGFLKLIEKLLT
jgi:inosine-uridine nucleoside N-ribohydrolase